jgi:tetratricopeptide (TPR) repeat protein
MPPDLRPVESKPVDLRELLKMVDQRKSLNPEKAPLFALLEGYAATRAKDLPRARKALNQETLVQSDESFVHLVCGRLLFLLGDLAASRTALNGALDRADSSAWYEECAYSLLRVLARTGLYRQAQDLSERVFQSDAAACWLHEAFALHFLELGDHQCTERHLARAQEEAGESSEIARLGIARARLLAQRGEGSEARDLLKSLSSSTAPEQGLALAHGFDHIGAFQQAEKFFVEREAVLDQARLSLWRGDLDRVAELLAEVNDDAEALRYQGAVALLDARLDEAEERLRASIALDPDAYESWIWMGELAMRQGQFEAASEHLKRGSELVENAPDHFAFQCLRIILGIRSGAFVPRSIVLSFEDVVEGVRLLIPDAPEIVDENADEALELLEHCLTLMRGNRSHRATTVVEAKGAPRLRLLELQKSLRTQAKTMAWTILYQNKAEVLKGFEGVMAQAPDSPLPHTYRGELHLWEGSYAEAAADFQLGIEKPAETAIWAYIGMGATQMLQGDPGRALQTFEEGVAVSGVIGPTLYAYRGEALWLCGDLEAARTDLEMAVAQRSERVGAWVVLGLVYGALDDQGGLARVLKHLSVAAPSLLSEGARASGLGTWPSSDELNKKDQVQLLNHVRDLLRGNRASAMVTFFDTEGRWCFVPPRSPWDPDFVESELLDIRVQLERAMGFRRTGFVLPAGAEQKIQEIFLPARPGAPIGDGQFRGIRIEQDQLFAVVEEADGTSVVLAFIHPELSGAESEVMGSVALGDVVGVRGPSAEALLDCVRGNAHLSLPWKETAPL